MSNSLQPHGRSSLSGSSVYGIFQARVVEWIAISFSGGSSQPRNRTRVSCIAGKCFTVWATREAKHARPPCPSPTSWSLLNLSPLSRWCHPTISSSVVPSSTCLQSFPVSQSFLMSQFFASGVQSTDLKKKKSATLLTLFSFNLLPLSFPSYPLSFLKYSKQTVHRGLTVTPFICFLKNSIIAFNS